MSLSFGISLCIRPRASCGPGQDLCWYYFFSIKSRVLGCIRRDEVGSCLHLALLQKSEMVVKGTDRTNCSHACWRIHLKVDFRLMHFVGSSLRNLLAFDSESFLRLELPEGDVHSP